MNQNPVTRILIPLTVYFMLGSNASFGGGDAIEGQALVRQWCETCHLSGSATSASDAGPPFAQMATDPAYSDDRLRGWLHDPHPPLPKFELDRRRIENILAYIRSLKP